MSTEGVPSSNKKHVGSLKYVGVGMGGGGYIKKTIKFCLADFGNEHQKYPDDIFDTFLQQ